MSSVMLQETISKMVNLIEELKRYDNSQQRKVKNWSIKSMKPAAKIEGTNPFQELLTCVIVEQAH